MKRKKRSEKPRKTILIVTANEAESLYFSQMRKDSRYTNMTVIWDEEATGVEDLIKRAAKERTRQKYDSQWVVFSFEDFGMSATEFKEVEMIAKKRKVQLAWANPSFSLWYLLHLTSPKSFVQSSELIDRELAKVLPQFDSSAEYLLSEGANLHLKLFPAKAQAVVNASQYNERTIRDAGGIAPVSMTKLLNDISTICGNADMTYNQKMIGIKNN
ncbi:MAG: RloB family protein [Sphaerochaetaceae bacterium]|jgi:hypothetical protein